jgi:hypothetical protein
MKHGIAFALLALAASIGATSLHGEPLSWHVGIAMGTAMDKRGPYDFDADADNSRSVFAGATHASGFGVEATYADLGRLHAPGIADGGFDLDGELWSLGATWSLSTGVIDPYAKLGWFWREDDGIALGIAGPTPMRIHDDGVTAEVGGRWRAGDAFALRLGYAWYDFDTDSDGSALLAAEWHF